MPAPVIHLYIIDLYIIYTYKTYIFIYHAYILSRARAITYPDIYGTGAPAEAPCFRPGMISGKDRPGAIPAAGTGSRADPVPAAAPTVVYMDNAPAKDGRPPVSEPGPPARFRLRRTHPHHGNPSKMK